MTRPARALEQALRSEAEYVSLVASPMRARVVVESLRARSIPEERLRRLKTPAGLDLDAVRNRGQHPGRGGRAPPAGPRGAGGTRLARDRPRRGPRSRLRDGGSHRDGASPLRERRGRRLFLLRGMPGAIRSRAGSLRRYRSGLTSRCALPASGHQPLIGAGVTLVTPSCHRPSSALSSRRHMLAPSVTSVPRGRAALTSGSPRPYTGKTLPAW